MKKWTLLSIFLAALLAAPGCRKKQPPPPPMPPQGAPAPPAMPGLADAFHGSAPAEKKVELPDAIRAAWKAVRIEVVDKGTKEKRRFVVPLDAPFEVPGTGLTLKAGPFFPHFRMEPGKITSESGRPENPAVRLEAIEGGREIFRGWLFAKFPDAHPFTHERYSIFLVEGVGK